MMNRQNLFASMLILLWVVSGATADWPQFRGKNSAGVYAGKPVPLEFGPGKNELWSLKLPPGHSSPCIHGNDLYLTGFERENKTLKVLCIDRVSGKVNWSRSISVERFEKGHPSFNPASSSPVTDGERVVAYFGSFGLICFSREGGKLWERRMPLTKSYAGNATSPAIFGNKVILYRGNHVDHFVVALDKRTGEEIWKVPQDEPFSAELACTSCPILHGSNVILHTARSVQALDLASGKQVWMVKCATTATSTPVIRQDSVLVAAWNKMGEPALRPKFPSYQDLIRQHDRDDDRLINRQEYPTMWIFHRPDGREAPENGATLRFGSVDKNRDAKITEDEWNLQLKRIATYRAGYQTHGMLAIPLDSRGLVKQSEVKTLIEKSIPEVPSPVVKDDLLYFVKNGGILSCIDLQNGTLVYRIRTKGKGTHYASPIIVNEHLFSFAGDGQISVISLGQQPKIVTMMQMNDRVYATPAVSQGVLYVRTHSKLYAFGQR